MMRMLKFVCLNDGDGKKLVSWGKDKLEAELEVDGHLVKRVYGKGVNAYYLDGKKYVSFGRGKVPGPIESVLNCAEVNFRHQIDGTMYWLTDSPGQMSKRLNEIVNLDVIDRSLAEAAVRVRKAKARADVSKDRIKSVKAKLAELDFVPAMGETLARLERRRDHARKARRQARLLMNSIREGETLAHQKDAIRRAVLQGKRTIAAGVAARQASERRSELQSSIDREIEVSGLVGSGPLDLSNVEAARARADEAAGRRRELEQSIQDELDLEEEACRIRSELEVLNQDMKKASRSDRCPTCGQRTRSPRSSSRTSTSAPTPHCAGPKKVRDGIPF